jgi:integrase
MARFKFIKTSIAALPAPEGPGPATHWDTETPGLALRITAKGRITFFVQARTSAGRQVKVGCGVFGRQTVEQAREKAKRTLAAIHLDRDPAAEKRAAREAERARREAERRASTVAELWRDFDHEHVAQLRPKSQDAYSTWFRVHVEPAIGQTRLGALTRGQVAALLKAIAERSGRSTSNRVQSILSALLSFGEAATTATGGARRYPECVNVARGIKRQPEPGRERDLSQDELRRLIAYLEASDREEARLIELLLATGARKGEALAMTWPDVRDGWWIVRAEVSKSKKTVKRPLNAAALEVLAKLRRGTLEVFPATTASRLDTFWSKARKDLQLEDVHLHDLRHAAASLAISAACRWPRSARCWGTASTAAP